MSVALIATDNLFGHSAHLLLDTFMTGPVVASFPRKFDYREVRKYIDEETSTLIILGHPFYKSQEEGFKDALLDLNLVGLPFSEVVHIASWGDRPNIKDVTSVFREGECLTTLLAEYLEEQQMSKVELNVGGKKLIKYLEDYHHYNFLHHPTSAPLSLKLLSDVYHGDMYKAVRITDKGVEFDTELRDALYRNMDSYLNSKLDQVELRVINSTVVILVYAEEYHNELAHKFIKAYNNAGYTDVIVLVGKQTKGDDMFHIRVSEGLHAGNIAKAINNGKGNDHAATVFLGRPRQFVMNSIESQLSSTL